MTKRRHDMTEIYYPHPVSLDAFIKEMQEALEPFKANMIHLGEGNTKYRFMEELFEMFARWSDIQSEGWDVFKHD